MQPTLAILTITLTMTDVPSKYVWKIKKSCIVFKEKNNTRQKLIL